MPALALLLLLVGFAVAFYAQANSGTHDVGIFGTHWSGVYDWVPVVIAAGAVAAVCILAMVYGALRIRSLRRAHAELLSEIARLRLERVEASELAEREVIGRAPVEREDATAGTPSAPPATTLTPTAQS